MYSLTRPHVVCSVGESNISFESHPSSPSATIENQTPDTPGREGFYMLRKDSERRVTVVKVINEDRNKICDTWMRVIHRDANITTPKLTKEHLLKLMDSMRDFIDDSNNKKYIQDAIRKLTLNTQPHSVPAINTACCIREQVAKLVCSQLQYANI